MALADRPLVPEEWVLRIDAVLGVLPRCRQESAWTGTRWAVSVVAEGGAPTIREAEAVQASALEAEALTHPLVQAALSAFPGAKVKVQSREEKAQAAQVEALPEVPDEWDPFEEG